MKFKKIIYLIDDSCGSVYGRVKAVQGFAIDYEPVRLCVRKQSRRFWTVDHYDTGFAINLPFYVFRGDKESVASAAVDKLNAAIKDGSYKAAIDRYEAQRSA